MRAAHEHGRYVFVDNPSLAVAGRLHAPRGLMLPREQCYRVVRGAPLKGAARSTNLSGVNHPFLDAFIETAEPMLGYQPTMEGAGAASPVHL